MMAVLLYLKVPPVIALPLGFIGDAGIAYSIVMFLRGFQ